VVGQDDPDKVLSEALAAEGALFESGRPRAGTPAGAALLSLIISTAHA
jgi:hypothetical protein